MSRPRPSFGPNPPGRLPAAMLRALAAELSDPGRFSRAKAYARDGAVFDIEVEPGEVRGQIQGSRYEPYLATLYVAPAEDLDSLLGLIPDRDEVMAECTCPDDGAYTGAFCKHALATLLVLADEVTGDTATLSRWRSGDAFDSDNPAVAAAIPGARSDAGAAARPVVDVLASLLTAPTALPETPDIPARLPVPMAHGAGGAAAVLADALAVLRVAVADGHLTVGPDAHLGALRPRCRD